MSSRIIVALDFPDPEMALAFAGQLKPQDCRLKVGFELFVAAGPELVRTLVRQGFEVFLDLKFHDIPNTVAAACRAAARLGVWMVNVHALGGADMMRTARAALAAFEQPPLLIAVTILTSMDRQQLDGAGLGGATPQARVLQLARLAQECGLDGVVCSAREAELLRSALGPDFLLVTPGIRPAGSAAGDQSRIMTPEQARNAGVSYPVIGRPVTQAANPLAAVHELNRIFGAL
ncbi:MAG: orotidine-5'-phosphate decarboxylase [Thiothrix sp.]|nr:orotidine-5'-phosphate decarboxylase [Thiothrix sp.]HPE59771.1 orotidine-5'-phosphate decarboxylase [Thiolinea sp.]